MPTSSVDRGPVPSGDGRAGSLRRGAGLLALGLITAALSSCAHAPPAAPLPAARGEAHRSGRASDAAPAPGSAAEAPAGAGVAPGQAAANQRLDPSEEITAEELATIPEPIPGGSAPTGPQKGSSRPSGPDSIAALGSGLGEAPTGSGSDLEREPGVEGWFWSVQVTATADLPLAGQVAREARSKLGVETRVEFESGFYKVRLGAFRTEVEAQGLRDRAVRGGYPGAFRIRCRADSSASKK